MECNRLSPIFPLEVLQEKSICPTSEDARVILLSLSDKALQQIGSLTSKQELLNKLVSLAPRLSYTINLVFKDTDS